MSYSYRIHRNPPVFVKPAGEHPGRAWCRGCRRRIPRTEPRIGWHGHYYCIPCWYHEEQGKEFLETLLSVLTDDMLVEAGLRVEHEEPEEPAPRTGSFNLNDFGVRMLRSRDSLAQGEVYHVEHFTFGASNTRLAIQRVSSPDEISGARIIRSDGSSWWYRRLDNFEVVLLDSAPESAETGLDDPIDDRLISHTGEEVVAGDLVRFIREVHSGHNKSQLLGQEFRVAQTNSSGSYRGRQWFQLTGAASGINFYDDELMLVSSQGS